jgi:hypothetical protein
MPGELLETAPADGVCSIPACHGSGRGRRVHCCPQRARTPDPQTREAVSAPVRRSVDLAGPPISIFRRALEHGNLLVAEATAKELPQLNLTDALVEEPQTQAA